jgi:DNA-binding NarL/FixJ family response regulator
MYAPDEKPLSIIEPVDRAAPARLIIADDHPLIRGALKAMLANEPDVEVVGEAKDGRQALELYRKLRPDLVLMDVQMPEMDGLAATRAIKKEHPGVIVLMVTAFEDPNYLLEAIKAGAAGYVLKHETPRQLLGAVRGVLNGESSLNQELAMRLLRRLADENRTHSQPPSTKKRQEPIPGSLTPRELEVLTLLAVGKTNRQIAGKLHLSLSTVKGYLERLISKLGVSDRTQAAVKAIELGLIDPDRREG